MCREFCCTIEYLTQPYFWIFVFFPPIFQIINNIVVKLLYINIVTHMYLAYLSRNEIINSMSMLIQNNRYYQNVDWKDGTNLHFFQ